MMPQVAFIETKLDALFFINRAVDLLFIADMVVKVVLPLPRG